MSDAYEFFREGQQRLRSGMTAQATVPLEKQGRAAEANGHYKLAHSMNPKSEQYSSRILDLE